MTLLMTTLLTSTTLILEAPTLIVAGIFVFGLCLTPSSHRENKPVQLDRHTLTDIGIVSGSITWMR
jgi:hypothetical protein